MDRVGLLVWGLVASGGDPRRFGALRFYCWFGCYLWAFLGAVLTFFFSFFFLLGSWVSSTLI